MSAIRRLVTDGSGDFGWQDVDRLQYKAEGSAPFKDITRQVLFSQADQTCELRSRALRQKEPWVLTLRPAVDGKLQIQSRVGTIEFIPHDPVLQPFSMRPDLVLAAG